MIHCPSCYATFAHEDAFQIHLGIGAPAFHRCNNVEEMRAKNMTRNQDGAWQIDPSFIVHRDKAHRFGYWAILKSEIANPDEWE